MSWTGELFCHLRVTGHRAAYWQIYLAICYQLQLCSLQNLRWAVQHDHRVWYMHNEACMVEWKSYMSSFSWRKLVFVWATDTSFLPLFTDNTFTNWFQLDSSTAMYCRGKIIKGGELKTNVWVISLLKLFTSKQMQDNPASSGTPV